MLYTQAGLEHCAPRTDLSAGMLRCPRGPGSGWAQQLRSSRQSSCRSRSAMCALDPSSAPSSDDRMERIIERVTADFRLSTERAVTESKLSTERAVTELKLSIQMQRFVDVAIIALVLASASADSVVGRVAGTLVAVALK